MKAGRTTLAGSRNCTLFLDHDGVMNHRAWLKTVNWSKGPKDDDLLWGSTEFTQGEIEWWASMVDPAKVAILNRITDETGCWIAVSSTWRLNLGLTGLEALYKCVGITGKLAGHTPGLGDFGRGAEIATFLWELLYHSKGRACAIEGLAKQAIAVVDDDPADMRCLRSRLTTTTMENGLTEKHALRIIKHLRTPIGPRLADRIYSLAANTERYAPQGHFPHDADSTGCVPDPAGAAARRAALKERIRFSE